MKKFEGYKLTTDDKKTGNYIHARTRKSKLLYSCIQGNVLIIDLYHVNKGVLRLNTTIKINNKYQWWKNGELQNKPLDISLDDYFIITNFKSYWGLASFMYTNRIEEYCILHYKIFWLTTKNLKIITTPRKNCFKYLPDVYKKYTEHAGVKKLQDGTIILSTCHGVITIHKNTIKYYRKPDFVQVPFYKLNSSSLGIYSYLFYNGNRPNSKNIGWQLYFIENNLLILYKKVLEGRIELKDVVKLSLFKKRLLNI